MVIIAGGIDLSLGSMIAFSGMVCGTTMLALAPEQMMAAKPVGGWVVAAGIGMSLLSGLAVGTLHAWMVTSIRLPPLSPRWPRWLAFAAWPGPSARAPQQPSRPQRAAQIYVSDPFFKMLRDNVWISVAVFAVLALVTWVLLTRTILGRHVHALGGNEDARGWPASALRM